MSGSNLSVVATRVGECVLRRRCLFQAVEPVASLRSLAAFRLLLAITRLCSRCACVLRIYCSFPAVVRHVRPTFFCITAFSLAVRRCPSIFYCGALYLICRPTKSFGPRSDSSDSVSVVASLRRVRCESCGQVAGTTCSTVVRIAAIELRRRAALYRVCAYTSNIIFISPSCALCVAGDLRVERSSSCELSPQNLSRRRHHTRLIHFTRSSFQRPDSQAEGERSRYRYIIIICIIIFCTIWFIVIVIPSYYSMGAHLFLYI